MRSTSRKLLLSLSTFIFALVTLFGATFAWFTAADQASLDGFNLTVSSGQNLLIKNSSDTFVTTLSVGEITTLYNNQHVTQGVLNPSTTIAYQLGQLRLSPLTSKNGSTFYLEQKTTTYADAARLYAPGAAGMFYFDLNITFRALVPLDVHLLYDATTPLFTSSKGYAGAYRLSLFEGATPIRIWESDAPVVGNSSLTRGGNFIDPTGPAAGLDLSGQTTSSALYNYESASADSSVNSKVFTMAAYNGVDTTNDRTVTVRIWIEGWDVLTINSLKDDVLTVALKFVGVTI